LVDRGLARGRVIDYGCGYGFDADHFGWEAYDPYYRPQVPDGLFDTVMCVGVISAVSRNNRGKIISAIRDLLVPEGTAYFGVPRRLPTGGKMGIGHSLQNYVVLTLPSVHANAALEIYAMGKRTQFEDRTKDYISPRDRRRDR
jgi:SAM-dependent methyltransferase